MSTTSWPDTACLLARLRRAQQAASAAGVDALLITPGSDLRYLLGVAGSSFERLTCLIVPADGSATLVVPKLERPGYAHVPTDDLGVAVATWVDGDDPYELAYRAVGASPQRIAVADMTPALHLLGLRPAAAMRRPPGRPVRTGRR